MNKKLLCLTNRIALRIDPAPDAVQTTADLVVMLLTTRCPASLSVRANPETQQIEIIAEYGASRASAPLLHPPNGPKKPKTTVRTLHLKKRRCTAAARLRRIN